MRRLVRGVVQAQVGVTLPGLGLGQQPPARPGPGLRTMVLTGAEVAAVQMGWGTINSQGAYISMPMHPNPILYANGPPCA